MEKPLQLANLCYVAATLPRRYAIDQPHWLERKDDLTGTDFLCWLYRGQAAGPSAIGFEISQLGKFVNDLYEMVLGNGIGLRNFPDRSSLVVFECSKNQCSQSKFGELVQFHSRNTIAVSGKLAGKNSLGHFWV